MAPEEWIAAGDFSKITAEVAKAVAAVQPTNGATGQ